MNLNEHEQQELRHNEQWLASLMARTPTTAKDRARDAVKLAMNERWLEQFPTDQPRPQAVRQVHSAIRRELRSMRLAVRYRLYGVMASAASILLVFGLTWHMTATVNPNTQTIVAQTSPLADIFVSALDAVEKDSALEQLSMEVARLDEEMTVAVRSTSEHLDDMELNAMQDRIDWLLTEPM